MRVEDMFVRVDNVVDLMINCVCLNYRFVNANYHVGKASLYALVDLVQLLQNMLEWSSGCNGLIGCELYRLRIDSLFTLFALVVATQLVSL